jgi:clan AA aspartic protease
MVTGAVTSLHPLVPVTFSLPGRADLTIEFVVDTGFTGALALPPRAIELLGLSFLHDTPADLADGTTVSIPLYSATILWEYEGVAVSVLATGPRPLLGTQLLAGRELRIQFVEGGLVTVEDL